MKSTATRTALTILLACIMAPVLGAYFLALLKGHGGIDFWIPEPGVIPFWLFTIPFVLPFTVPAAIFLCLGSAYFAKRQWNRRMNRIVSFIGIGFVSSLPYPVFMTVMSLRSTFDSSKYGVTRHERLTFLTEHWIAAAAAGIIAGLLLSLIWKTKQTREDANQSMEPATLPRR